jgi:energy-coupling factor transporter transmembrane protein EcfT
MGVTRTYYIDKNKMNLSLFIIFFSLIPFSVFVKNHTKQAWLFLLGIDAILLIAAYFDSTGLFEFTLISLIFQLPILATLIFLFRIGKIKFSGGKSGDGEGGDFGEGSGGSGRGGRRNSGGFGGGRSGGGGSSGKW